MSVCPHGGESVVVALAWFALGLVVPAVSTAQAPVIVVIESDAPRVSPRALRDALAAELQSPVVRLSDREAAGAAGTLSIAVERDGRHATVYYRSRAGVREAVLVEVEAGRLADAAGRWLAAPAAAAVRTVNSWILQPSSEVLDPWLEEHRQDPTSEPSRVRAVYVGVEVLDPWGETTRTPAIIGPWARRLNAPAAPAARER